MQRLNTWLGCIQPRQNMCCCYLKMVAAGLLYGAWVDGLSVWRLVGGLAASVALLGGLMWTLHRRQRRTVAGA